MGGESVVKIESREHERGLRWWVREGREGA